ncbi:MAG: BolA family transcriptional regulator [Rhodobacteraceae bacterium]|nr:BolA family transcriptional regulator [Paracoccaceae bacterium]
MTIADEIAARLEAAFAPEELAVRDDSARHEGHAGWRPGGETHFHVTIRAASLRARPLIERHRAVHAALGPDLIGRIHALALSVG